MMVVLDAEQEAMVRQMSADLDMPTDELLRHLVSDRLAQYPLTLWRE